MIKEEQVEIIITSNVKDYYENLGYSIPKKMRTKMLVNSKDLPASSGSYITRICDECGDEHIMKRLKYVPVCRKCNSPKMAKARKDDTLTTCPDCGTQISYSAKRCKDCFGKTLSGDNNPMYGKKLADDHPLVIRNKALAEFPELHHNWKGGKGGRTGKQLQWGKDIKSKYANICDCCGYDRRYALEAHHYELSEAKYPVLKEEWTVDNGVALCSNCHKEFHKKYGYGSNSIEQYIEFKNNYTKLN